VSSELWNWNFFPVFITGSCFSLFFFRLSIQIQFCVFATTATAYENFYTFVKSWFRGINIMYKFRATTISLRIILRLSSIIIRDPSEKRMPKSKRIMREPRAHSTRSSEKEESSDDRDRWKLLRLTLVYYIHAIIIICAVGTAGILA